jgi:hypothetical protein
MGALAGLRLAWKIGPWVVIGGLLIAGMFLRAELRGAQETIRADAATCSAERAADANALDQKAQVTESALASQLSVAQAALLPVATVNVSSGASLRASLQSQAAQPGQDGPLAPVLQNALAGLRANHGDAP